MDQPTSPSPRPLPPRSEFDEAAYLRLHPDVAAAIAAGITGSAWQHFTLHGLAEGRAWVAQPDFLDGVMREISPRDEMFLGNPDHYLDVGHSALVCIEAALATARRAKTEIRTVLDLPCGHGRVLRFLKRAFPQARLTACDLNADGVDYCARTFGATPVVSQVDPERIPLQGPFDLIWCGSLLTHLDDRAGLAFLRRFGQMLSPGGIAVFTLHGRSYEADLVKGWPQSGLDAGQTAKLLEAYRGSGFGYVDYTAQSGYGFSLSHPAFVMREFVPASGCRLLGYHESGWDGRQDVVCLQR